jgi:hypothetical protein
MSAAPGMTKKWPIWGTMTDGRVHLKMRAPRLKVAPLPREDPARNKNMVAATAPDATKTPPTSGIATWSNTWA